jgi:hypothetical protein
VGEGETYSGESETVESVAKNCRAGEVLVFPELVKQWVVGPVVVTEVVQI